MEVKALSLQVQAKKEVKRNKIKFVGNVSTCCKSMPNLNFSYKTINKQNQTNLKYKNIKEYTIYN